MSANDAMNYERKNSSEIIERLRREPLHCLYCDQNASSVEHIVPESIGGRLTASIICGSHNGIINTCADNRLATAVAPFVNILEVPRQRGSGKVGAVFTGVDSSGRTATVGFDGFVRPDQLTAERDERGLIVSATGDLSILESLPRKAFSDHKKGLVIAHTSAHELNVSVALGAEIHNSILKIAVHFVAGFVCDISTSQIEMLQPYILGEKSATDIFVRTPATSGWLPNGKYSAMHEITCYPYGDGVYVSILLFGIFIFACALPIKAALSSGVRYSQFFDRTYPVMQSDIAIPHLEWDELIAAEDIARCNARYNMCSAEIERRGDQRAIRARCERAYTRALEMSHNYGDLWSRYKTALQLECFSSEHIYNLIRHGRYLAAHGKQPWEVEVG